MTRTMKSIASIVMLSGVLFYLTIPIAYADDESPPVSVCEFVAQTASEANSNISRETVVGNNSAPFVTDYLIQSVFWNSANPSAPNIAYGDTVWRGEQNQYYESHIRWSHESGYLPYLRKWFKILSQTDAGALRSARSSGAYPRAVLGEQGLVCAFNINTFEHPRPTLDNWFRAPKETINCEEAIEPTNIILPTLPLPEENWPILEEQLSAEHGNPDWFKRSANPWSPFLDGQSIPRSTGPVIQIDINNDGHQETLLNIIYSESGRGVCGTTYFDLINDDMDAVSQSDLRTALLEAQGISRDDKSNIKYLCGSSNHIVSVDGQIVISTSMKLHNHISIVEDEETTKVCTSTFTLEPIIVFDALSNGE